MRFDSFIGNPRVVERIRTKLREGRFPHALIFSGAEGVGKRTFALMLAKALNCRQGEADDFCDSCSQCRKIDSGTHPDVVMVGVEEEASEIKIAQIRDVLHVLELRPLEGVNKVFIIDPADAMNAASANALLKGLEEPPENSYFILLSSNPHSLMVTVRSRSQSYAFTPLTLDELRQFGGEELALRWARGSIGTLKTLDLTAVKERRSQSLRFLETAIGAKEEDFRDLMAASGNLARAKNDFDSNIGMLAVLLEDVLYLQQGLKERIVNVDIVRDLQLLAASLSTQQCIRIGEFLRTIEVHANNYGNRQMLVDVLGVTSNAALGKFANDITVKSR
jgi:DNA polymerase III delta' subunit